jgi:hypothetical protein
LAAAVLGGLSNIWIVRNLIFGNIISFLSMSLKLHFTDIIFCCFIKKPGAKVLYLGAASGTSVSHVSDIVGPVSMRSNFDYLEHVCLSKTD